MKPLCHLAVIAFSAAAITLPLGGCGDSGVTAATTAKTATPAASVRRQLSDRRSPASTVARFWASIQEGALPLSLALYEPKVVAAVGLASFAGMLNEQRGTSAEARLNVLRVEDVADSRLVSAEAVPKVGPKTRHSFFLRRVPRRRPARWRIVYDTLSAGAIQAYVQNQTQRAIDPSAPPARKAVVAGDQAAATYRAASLGAARSADRRSTSRPARSPETGTAGQTTTAAP